MFINTQFQISGLPVAFLVRGKVESRLSKTCFRGMQKRLAGNFSAFGSCLMIFNRDPSWIEAFVADATRVHADRETSASYSFDYGCTVGWSGTAPLVNYDESDLELFNPNKRSQAFRIRIDRLNIKAPTTSIVTLVYEIKVEASQVLIIIHSVYPGEDIGELDGHVSHREFITFFDWNHPGEDLEAA